ncbi:BZIP domain-containing protein [Mycena venus]|uniref:BZIP domain-containing protein n=1 Tax=Mycena venus TaxID=2733690 RepID=A0A8H6XDT9_9AGAR|nr:BZIP domain-containing protein [Mycena venus]
MAPSSLHGLNLVHPPHSSSSSQDLLSGPPFPDLLWNNLVFDSDEPLVDDKYGKRNTRESDEELELEANRQAGESVLHQGHVNVVTGTNVGETGPQQPFDINSFLANLGQPPTSISPSIVQLLALHSAVQNGSPAFSTLPAPEQSSSAAQRPSTSYDYPPAKRARSRKPSISTSAADSPEDVAATAISVAEDKRRRNTAASARFRLKKKEREAALETRAKELEGRVNELERECEGLRRENGWLKGLVVGVTGAAQQQVPQQTSAPQPSLKRSRDDLEAAQ